MNRHALLLAIPFAIALPVAAFTQLRQPHPAVAAPGGKDFERRLTIVTQQTIAQAIDEGAAYLRGNPGARFTIRLPAGRFDLAKGSTATTASIDLSRIDACPGTLVIDGAGMDRTTLVRQNEVVGIIGRDTRCVTISDLGFTQNRIEMSQGSVVSADRQRVTLDIPAGFPTPDALMPTDPTFRTDGSEVVRRYVRKYIITTTGPQIVEGSRQVRWTRGERAGGGANRWTLTLADGAASPTFRRGDLIGIKAKSGGQAYRFVNGDHITFDHVRWALDARGVFRRVDNVTVQNCVVARPAPIDGVPFLLSTSGGGPQVGQPNDAMTSGHLIQNNVFTGMGDDGIMFAHATGTVRNNRITDSFARGILVVASPDATIKGNVLTRAPLLNVAAIGDKRDRPRLARRRAAANDDD